MFAVLLSILLSIAVGFGLGYTQVARPGWSVFWGILAFLVSQASLGLFMRGKMRHAMEEIQRIMQAGQRKLQHKTDLWKRRPPSSLKQAQAEVAKEQAAMVEQALAVVGTLQRYYPWVPLLSRQADTLKMQFHWQLKEFDKVDALLPRAICADPQIMAIKVARLYQTHADGQTLDQTFRKLVRKLRYGQGELLYCLYAWIQLKNGNLDGALKTLVAADAKMESKTVKHNRDLLANNKPQHFSLAGLGDAWYALWLEEPKVRQQRITPHQAKRFF